MRTGVSRHSRQNRDESKILNSGEDHLFSLIILSAMFLKKESQEKERGVQPVDASALKEVGVQTGILR